MYLTIFLSILLAVSSTLCAQPLPTLSPLLRDFLSSNLQLKVNRLQESQSAVERDILRGQKTWSLMGNISHQTHDKKRNSLLGISKDFEWGGSLRTEHSRFTSESQILTDNKKNSLTYAQDLGRNFFGKQFYLSLELAKEHIKYSELNLSETNQEELYHFHQNYLKTRLAKTLLALQNQALKRSQDRLNEIKRKVRDGLSGNSDLYLAKIEYLRKKEELATKELSWANTKRELSQKLNRDIESEEIELVSLAGQDLTKSKKYDLRENFSFKKMKSHLRKIDKEIKKLKRNYIPKINLSFTRQLNDSDQLKTPPLSPLPTTPERDNIISISVQLPLTYAHEKSKISHKRIEAMSWETRKKLAWKKLKTTEKNLEEEIKTLLQKLDASLSRIDLAKKNLKENTKLYSIGKTNLDNLLRAEEELIRTELSYVNSWFQHETAVAKKATLYGKLLETIQETNG